MTKRSNSSSGQANPGWVNWRSICPTGSGRVPPASTAQVAQLDAVDSRGIPMGGRIQLDPSWDVENSELSPAGKVIARALQEYGAFCGDYAGANVLYAENSPAAVAAWQGVLSPEDLAAVEHKAALDMLAPYSNDPSKRGLPRYDGRQLEAMVRKVREPKRRSGMRSTSSSPPSVSSWCRCSSS